jgi:hypothetical protein
MANPIAGIPFWQPPGAPITDDAATGADFVHLEGDVAAERADAVRSPSEPGYAVPTPKASGASEQMATVARMARATIARMDNDVLVHWIAGSGSPGQRPPATGGGAPRLVRRETPDTSPATSGSAPLASQQIDDATSCGSGPPATSGSRPRLKLITRRDIDSASCMAEYRIGQLGRKDAPDEPDDWDPNWDDTAR